MDTKLIPSFQQIPYTELVKRIDEGSNGILDLSNMLHERKEIHEKTIIFEQRMSKSNIFTHEIPTSTSERMLGFFKNFYIFVARAHIKTHKDFNDSVLKELEDLKLMRTTTVNRTKQLVSSGLRDIQHAEDMLEKAKKTFAKAKADYERGVDKLKNLERAVIEHQRTMEEKKRENISKDPSKFSMGRMFQSAFESHPEQDRDKQIKKVERRHDDMIHAANAIVERKRVLLNCMDSLDRYLQEAASIFQELELDRMRRLKSMMRRFCDAERSLLKAKEEQLALLEESINFQEPEDDMLLFITQEKLTEATHKYGGAVKLLDEYLYRKREGVEWSFTTCDEYSVVDHAQLIAGLVADASIEGSATAAATGNDVDPSLRLAEYDTGNDTSLPTDMTIQDILEEEQRQTILSAAIAEAESKKSNVSPKLKPLVDALELIFAPDNPADSRKLSFSQWESLLESEEARDHFLLVLDDKRCVSASLDAQGYAALAVAMQTMLSICEQYDDAKKAMRVLNMANTFYLSVEERATAESVEDIDGASRLAKKHYLQVDERLQKHPIWRKQNFWENALKEGVFAEMEKVEPTPWDELTPEGLKETIINIHNLVFGQLGTLSLTMREQTGLDRRELASYVLVLSRKFQLCEDQEYELLHSLTGQPIKEYQPPPIIPNAPVAHLDESDVPANLPPVNHSKHSVSVVMDNGGRSDSNESASVIAGGSTTSSPRSQSSSKTHVSQGHHHSHHGHHSHHHSNSSSNNNTSASHLRHSHSHISNSHHNRDHPIVEGTATVVGISSSATAVRRSSHQHHSEPVVVSGTLVSSSDSASSQNTTGNHQSTANRSSQSSNPFSFMLGMTGSDNSGKRSRTSSNNHDDFFATL